VVLWDLQGKEAICGSSAAVPSAGITYAVAFANNDDKLFFTAGEKTLRIWNADIPNRKIRPTECNLGQLKRDVHCIQVSEDNQFFYCGTTSGDILIVSVKNCILKDYGPKKDKYSKGVKMIKYMKNGNMLIGCGDGTVAVVSSAGEKPFRKIRSMKVEGAVTSIALRGNGHQVCIFVVECHTMSTESCKTKESFCLFQFFVGTDSSNMYKFNHDDLSWELIKTSHSSCINDIFFPFEYSDVFGTCSRTEIRLWNTLTSKELLRIEVANMKCDAMDIMRNGKSIISGWDDGKIRAFTPKTGKLQYEIGDAHSKGVTALATTSNSESIVSGGGEGQVRVWNISGENPKTYKLKTALKEHKGAVTCIKVKNDDKQCISASADGTCIIWDLENSVRSQIVFANTMFKAVCYSKDESQVITAGTDRKIAYWETYDGSLIRELEGSTSGSIEGMDISMDGEYFVTGGTDKLIKVPGIESFSYEWEVAMVWKYNKGEVTHVGIGHCGDVQRVKICPRSKYIISVSNDGSVLRWKYPPVLRKCMQPIE
ncbi:hypothetical protein QZH41_011696, partial [Actinostola sp. cb2023]